MQGCESLMDHLIAEYDPLLEHFQKQAQENPCEEKRKQYQASAEKLELKSLAKENKPEGMR